MKRFFNELTNGMILTCSEYEIIGRLVLKYSPHPFAVVRGISPIASGFKVAEDELFRLSADDSGDLSRDLFRHEGVSAAGRFVVEQDTVAGVNVIRFPKVNDRPESK